LTIQLTHIFYPEVFKRYSNKYNVFRDLHEKDLLALEIRDIEYKLAKDIRNIILAAKEICYLVEKEKKVASDILILGSFLVFKELAKEIIAEGNEDLGQKIIRVLAHLNLRTMARIIVIANYKSTSSLYKLRIEENKYIG